jgi:hypothetical protein
MNISELDHCSQLPFFRNCNFSRLRSLMLVMTFGLMAHGALAQNDARVLSIVAPASVATGATFTATITMTNSGANPWSTANSYSLGLESPRNNTRWLASGRVALPNDVNPGDTVTFTSDFTAPTTPGIYTFTWSMLQEGVEWFGQLASTTIRVGNGRFTPGDVVVMQVLSTAVDPPAFNTAGTALVLQDISPASSAITFEVDLPLTGSNALVTGGNPFSGMIDLSTDKSYLVVGGYNTNAPYRPAGANVSVEASGSPVPRAIGVVNSGGQYRLRASTTTGFSGGTFRGVVSDGQDNFWGGAQNGGIYYFGNNSAPVQINPAGAGAIRDMIMVNGRPFFSTSQFPAANNFGVVAFSSVAPTSPEVPTLIIDSGNAVTGATGTANPKGFCVNSNLTIAYVVDLRSASAGGGIYRYNGTGTGLAGSWTYQYTLVNGLFANGGAFQEVIADFNGANPTLYATAAASATGNSAGNTLVTAVDSGPTTTTFSTIAAAPSGASYRGLTFAPKPISLSITKSGGNVVVRWSGGGVLLSASTVTGPYTPVAGSPISPYTTPATSSAVFYAVGAP